MTPAVRQIYERDLSWRGWNKDSRSHMGTAVPWRHIPHHMWDHWSRLFVRGNCGEAGLRTSSCDLDIALTGIWFLTKLFYRSRTKRSKLCNVRLSADTSSPACGAGAAPSDGMAWPSLEITPVCDHTDKCWELRNEKESRQMNWSLMWSQACELQL